MPKPIHVFGSDGQLRLEPTFTPSWWRRALYEGIHYSRILEVVNEARKAWEVRKLRQQDDAKPEDSNELGVSKEVYTPPSGDAWRGAWGVTDALLGVMNREAKAAGARFAVTTVTLSDQVHPDPAVRAKTEKQLGMPNLFYAEQRIAQFGAHHGFAVIRLGAPLQALATREKAFLHGFPNTVMGLGH
jgi:hypothetical protein